MDLIPLADPVRIKTKPRDDVSAEAGMAGALAAFLSILGDAAGATPTPEAPIQVTEMREKAAVASGPPVPSLAAAARPIPGAGDASTAMPATVDLPVAAGHPAGLGRPSAEDVNADAATIGTVATSPATRTATLEIPQSAFRDGTAARLEAPVLLPQVSAEQPARLEAMNDTVAAAEQQWAITTDRSGTNPAPVAAAAGEPRGDPPRLPQAGRPNAPGHEVPQAEHAKGAPQDRIAPDNDGMAPAPAGKGGGSTADPGDPAPPGQRPVVVPATSAAPDSMAATHRPFVTGATPGDGPRNRQDLPVPPQTHPETAHAAGGPAGMTPPQTPAPALASTLGVGVLTEAPNLPATVAPGEKGAQPVAATAPDTQAATTAQEPARTEDTAPESALENNETPIDTGDPVSAPMDGPSLQRGPDRAAANHPATGPLPAGLGHRLAEVVSHFPDRPVEITLSPEELGRVRLTLATHDGALTMMVQADRPDTLDLLRRNIDSLAQDFRDLGYQDLTFSFGQERDPRQPPAPDARIAFSEPDPDQGAADTTADDRPRHSVAGGGLDLRL